MAVAVGQARHGARGTRGYPRHGPSLRAGGGLRQTRSDLAALLDDVAADEDGPEVRVVLLARSAGEWWQQLLASVEELTSALLEASALVTLGPVRAAGGLREVFDDAVTAFAQKVGVDVRTPGWCFLIRIRWCW